MTLKKRNRIKINEKKTINFSIGCVLLTANWWLNWLLGVLPANAMIFIYYIEVLIIRVI